MSSRAIRLAAGAAMAATLWAQTQVDLANQGRNVDFRNATSTRPVKTGSSLPATCQAGELFFSTTASAGQNLYGCTAAGQWVVQASGTGGSALPSGGADGKVLTWDSGEAAWGTTTPGAGLSKLQVGPDQIWSVDSSQVPHLALNNAFLGNNQFAGTITFTPGAMQTVTAAAPIDSGRGAALPLTSDSDVVMTATPAMSAGTDGQAAMLVNRGLHSIRFQDDSALSGSGMCLAGNQPLELGAGQAAAFVYNAAAGCWVEIGRPQSGGGVWGSITGSLSNQSDLWAALSAKSDAGHSHAAAEISSGVLAPERLGAGTPSGQTYLRGDGTWVAPSPGEMSAPWVGTIALPAIESGRVGCASFAASGARPGTALSVSVENLPPSLVLPVAEVRNPDSIQVCVLNDSLSTVSGGSYSVTASVGMTAAGSSYPGALTLPDIDPGRVGCGTYAASGATVGTALSGTVEGLPEGMVAFAPRVSAANTIKICAINDTAATIPSASYSALAVTGSGGGGGGGGAWGSIIGTLSDQADLQAALDSKVASSRNIGTALYSGLSGGGNLSADRSLAISPCQVGEIKKQAANGWECAPDEVGGGIAGTTGSGNPLGNCTAGQAIYLDTTTGDSWYCSAANTWRRLLSVADTGASSVRWYGPTGSSYREIAAGAGPFSASWTMQWDDNVPGTAGVLKVSAPVGGVSTLSASALSAADLPVVPLDKGGTGATTAAGARSTLLPATAGQAGKVLMVNSGGTDYELGSVSGSGGSSSGRLHTAVNNAATSVNQSGVDIELAGSAFTLPGGALGANDCLQIDFRHVNSTANSKTYKLMIGAAVYSYASGTTQSPFTASIFACNNGTTSSQYVWNTISGGLGPATLSVDTTANQTVKLAVNCSSGCSTDTVTLQAMVARAVK